VILVVDTNIVFSGILSPEGTISDLLLNSTDSFSFYAPSAIIDELDKHHKKLVKISGLSDSEIQFLRRMLLRKIELIDLESIRSTTWERALELTGNVDEFDAPFIALSLELEAPLWTGDKKLIKGLKTKGIEWILDTNQIIKIRD
jgi:predicted nucleic acid-binding protein